MLFRFILILILLIFNLPGCENLGTSSSNSESDLPNRRIQNPVLENTTPLGLSSFSIGVENKFPYLDEMQAENIGFIAVAESVRNIATNELYTFPEKPNQEKVFQILEQLVNDGYSVTHEIHILNGPGMRESRDRWINEIVGSEVSDEYFNYLLKNNQFVRDSVLNLFAEVVEFSKRLEEVGIKVLICPELEDNQDDVGFNIYLNFLDQLGWPKENTVRNGGSVGEIPIIRYEVHVRDIYYINNYNLRSGDIVNTDGRSFYFNSDGNKPDYLFSEDEIRFLRNYCQEKNIIFYIWSANLQGLEQVASYNYIPNPEYHNRNYNLLKPKEFIAILLNIKSEEVIVQENT